MAGTVGQDYDPLSRDNNAWFFKDTGLDELLGDAKPLRSMDDLAIEDVTPQEAESFLRAVEE